MYWSYSTGFFLKLQSMLTVYIGYLSQIDVKQKKNVAHEIINIPQEVASSVFPENHDDKIIRFSYSYIH